MNLFQAAILGAVEGLTEFLPVSSTGHLILAAHAMGLVGRAVDDFEIVIQAGALLAVLWLYRARVIEALCGVTQPGSAGRGLLLGLAVAFVPAAVLGLALHHRIEEHLFGPLPVALALFVGGIVMVLFERRRAKRGVAPRYERVDGIPLRVAFWIGVFQCLSLWPGVSRSMVTILAGLLLGCSAVAAAEFSFLLALPTLGAATLYGFLKSRQTLLSGAAVGPAAMIVGLAVAAVVAAIAIRSFIRWLTRHGLAPFGWYRIALGLVLLILLWGHRSAP
jgi:undecaprenyl-diphosphatase